MKGKWGKLLRVELFRFGINEVFLGEGRNEEKRCQRPRETCKVACSSC